MYGTITTFDFIISISDQELYVNLAPPTGRSNFVRVDDINGWLDKLEATIRCPKKTIIVEDGPLRDRLDKDWQTDAEALASFSEQVALEYVE